MGGLHFLSLLLLRFRDALGSTTPLRYGLLSLRHLRGALVSPFARGLSRALLGYNAWCVLSFPGLDVRDSCGSSVARFPGKVVPVCFTFRCWTFAFCSSPRNDVYLVATGDLYLVAAWGKSSTPSKRLNSTRRDPMIFKRRGRRTTEIK